MKGRGVVLALLLCLTASFISAGSIDDHFKKLTHYAEEYETGNIDYVQLSVYMSSVRESLNEELGVVSKEMGGILKQEQIQNVLGDPNEYTKWVWVEGEDHEKKLDKEVPIWRKIIFDGRKIQIRMDAHPSIFSRKQIYDFEEDEERREKKLKRLEDLEGKMIYRLHFQIEFKKPKEQLDIQSKIEEIKSLAEIFNSNPSKKNAENLAKESVSAERIFENYFRQNQGKCEDIMMSIFGAEYQREMQKILVQEIEFYEGENFEAILRLEMCDDCDWNWVNLDMWFDSRGRFKHPEMKDMDEKHSRDRFKGMSIQEFKSETQKLLTEITMSLENGDYDSAMRDSNKLRMLTHAWNEKSNDVWEQVHQEFQLKHESMTDEERYEFDQNFGWIKQDQEQRKLAKQLMEANYEGRKSFYLSIFSPYDKKEYYFEQKEWEKRLIQEFRESGEEICNNNKDDNNNEQIDCAEEQCSGQICGRGTEIIQDGNGTKEIEVNFYCISGECKAKEEIKEDTGPICGNNICESGESICSPSLIECEDPSECFKTNDCGSVYCPEDCTVCPEYPPIECSGKVIFSGEDEKGCHLEPICIEEEKESCSVDEDCIQPLCGVAECVRENEEEFGKCEVTNLKMCEEVVCTDGEKQVEKCSTGEELVTALCDGGMWIPLDTECSIKTGESCHDHCMDYLSVMEPACPGHMEISGEYPSCSCDWVCEDIVEEECITKEDCGGENDVCSNGRCVTIPQIIEEPEEPIEIPEPIPQPEEDEKEDNEEYYKEKEDKDHEEYKEEKDENEIREEEPKEDSSIGEGILGFFMSLGGNMKMTGHVVEGEGGSEVVEEVEEDPEEEKEEPEENIEENDERSHDEWDGECPDAGEPPEEKEGCWYEETHDGYGCVSGYDYFCDEEEHHGDWEDKEEYHEEYEDKEYWEEKDRKERERHEKEQRERCSNDCNRPCVEKCIREVCGDEMDCNIDKERKPCEESCSPDKDCIEKCVKGEDEWWKEFEEHEEWKEEKGVFSAGGSCRKSQGRTEGHIWLHGWGDPFNDLEPLKHKYYQQGHEDWCKHDMENLVRQRQEFQKGFNQKFAQWFFEKYLANAAEDWEQASSGIFEIYWRNVDNQREFAHRMQCLGVNDINEIMKVKLLNMTYESEYGSIEYWEEIETVDFPEIDEEVTIISPYMKIWIFPPKEFITYELRKAMEEEEFPGSPEDKMERENEGGPNQEEKELIKQDEKFMKRIHKITKKYDGNLDVSVQLKDPESSDVIFNLYTQINEEDILKVKPMLPEAVPDEDIRMEVDFNEIFDLIYTIEKEMNGARIESPPWSEDIRPISKIKEVAQGIRIFFKVRSIINDAEVYPKDARDDVDDLFKTFISMMMKMGDKEEHGEGEGFEGEREGEEELSEEEAEMWEKFKENEGFSEMKK